MERRYQIKKKNTDLQHPNIIKIVNFRKILNRPIQELFEFGPNSNSTSAFVWFIVGVVN